MTTQELVQSEMALAGVLANRALRCTAPYVRREMSEDVRQEGKLGLVKAAGRYNPDLGVPFGAYARLRIAGEIMDAQRRLDYLTRQQRREVESGLGDDPGFMLSLTPMSAHDCVDKGPGPEEKALAAELREMVMAMPGPEREVLLAWHWMGEKAGETAARLGVPVTTIYGRRTAAIDRLRGMLGVELVSRQARVSKPCAEVATSA